AGTAVNSSYYDAGNVLFGTTHSYPGGAPGTSPSPTAIEMFSTGPRSGATFVSNGIVMSASGNAPHSLTIETSINHSGTGLTTVDAHVYADAQTNCDCTATSLANQ